MSEDGLRAKAGAKDEDEKSSIESFVQEMESEELTPIFMVSASVRVKGELKTFPFWFRRPKTANEYENAYKRGAVEFARHIKDIESGKKGAPEPLTSAVSRPNDTKWDDWDLFTAYLLHFWSDEGHGQIDQGQALRMVKLNPGAMSELAQKVDEELKGGAIVLNFGTVMSAKKNSDGTKPAASGSKRRVASTKRTQTI